MSLMQISIRIKKGVFWFFSVLIALFLVVISQHTVFAAGDDIQTKSEMTALYFCYNSPNVHSPIKYSLWHDNGLSSLTLGGHVYVMDSTSASMTSTQCNTLIGKFSNKIPNNKSASQSESDSFFRNMGYNIETEGEDQGYCAIYHFSKNNGATTSEYRMCDPEATINEAGKIIISGKNLNYTFLGDGEPPLDMSYWRKPGVNGGVQYTKLGCVHSGNMFNKGWPVVIEGADFTKYANEVFQRVYGCNLGTEMAGLNGGWQVEGDQAEVISNQKVTYILPKDRTGASMKAIQYLFNDKSITSASKLKLTTNQEKEVLTNALNNYYHFSFFGNTEESGCNLDDTAKSNAESLGYIELKINKTKKCYVKATGENEKKKIRLYNNSTKLLDGTEMDFAAVVKTLSELAEKNNLTLDLKPTPIDGTTTDDEAAASCFTDGDALGWIICPVLKMAGSAAAATYENILTNWLRMDVAFFNTDGDNSGTYEGWSQFRDLANIIFAIFFVIVILAQVTGIGISNYNIKKILPKLIVVVILVNVSFLLCQLAVDVSNILGASLYDMLTGLPTGNGDGFGLDNLIGGMLGTIGTALIGGTAITAGVVAAISNPGAILIPLLLAILSALIGLLFFFIILAVRKAGVIVLVVLAPVAIVCYALPNTKSLFDKWKKFFMALLMVYPICSILMGGGYFVSNLMLKSSDNGFVESLVAMLLQIIPIFFVPTILRSSLAVAGNIGTKISSFGSRLSGRATGAIRNADATQRLKTSMDYWGATKGQKAVGAISRGVGRIPGVDRIQRSRFGRAISAGHNRSVARSMVNYEKMRLDEGNNQFIAANMTPDSIQQALDTQQFEQEQRLINNAAQSIAAGSASYADASGNSQAINVNDLKGSNANSLVSALTSLRNQYDASGGTDRQLGNQMNAVAKTMISRYGDKGRSLVMESLKSNADSTGTFSRSSSFDSLCNYISRDEKWMSALKKEDPGAFSMVSDGANAIGLMKNLQAYNAEGPSKITASSVPNLSKDFFDGYKDAINIAQRSGVFSSNNTADIKQVEDFDRMVQSFEQAAADPIISRSIKPDDLKQINEVNKELYNAKRDGWKNNNPGKTDADYATQFGIYRDIAIGQSVKISHKQMPVGWHRATTAEANTHGARIGFNEGDWIDGSSSTPTRLSTADQKRAEAIEDYNIKADLNNNP